MTVPAENRPEITPELGEPERAGSPAEVEPVRDPAPPVRQHLRLGNTRTSAAWVGVWAGVVALILLIIFVAQNTARVRITFFALEGEISLALALLIAGVGGAIVAMAVAATRILQLRRMVRRGR
jgi:uncharacterized integral membrane protein